MTVALVRTAGRGTSDWNLDRAYETDTEKRLEKAYREDDFPVSSIADEFSTAKYFIGQALDHMIRAAREADQFGRAQPIDDLIDKLQDDFEYQMDRVIKNYREGKA